jgi:hydrogenase nickel incorporation protein HypA/HybF
MHEYSIASALLELAAEHAAKRDADRVVALEISVGELSGVEIELLETAWSLVRERSICEGVPLSISRVEARFCCRDCGESVPRGERLACGACGGPAQLTAGDELLLQRIEMEVT